eukprot:SAG11_NODE_826_length_6982_cov_4.139038_3_plen_148_part_00
MVNSYGHPFSPPKSARPAPAAVILRSRSCFCAAAADDGHADVGRRMSSGFANLVCPADLVCRDRTIGVRWLSHPDESKAQGEGRVKARAETRVGRTHPLLNGQLEVPSDYATFSLLQLSDVFTHIRNAGRRRDHRLQNWDQILVIPV